MERKINEYNSHRYKVCFSIPFTENVLISYRFIGSEIMCIKSYRLRKWRYAEVANEAEVLWRCSGTNLYYVLLFSHVYKRLLWVKWNHTISASVDMLSLQTGQKFCGDAVARLALCDNDTSSCIGGPLCCAASCWCSSDANTYEKNKKPPVWIVFKKKCMNDVVTTLCHLL